MGFLARKSLLMLSSLASTIAFLVTNEMSDFVSGVAKTFHFFDDFSLLAIVAILSMTIVATLYMHERFIRKPKPAIQITFYQVAIQLSGVALASLFIVFSQEGTPNVTQHIANFAVIALLLSAPISLAFNAIGYDRDKPKTLVRIESVLQKNIKEEIRKPRAEQFYWRDFERGLVSSREEVDILVRMLDKDNRCLVIGNQASGKTVTLLDLGYTLSKKGYIAFFINADQLDVDDVYSDLEKWNMTNVVLIIDDVQRNPALCERLLTRTRALCIKVILASRPLAPSVFREGEGLELKALIQKKVEIHVTQDVIIDIIRKYCLSLGFRYMSKHEDAGSLYEDVSNVMNICGNDLWILRYLLLSWDPTSQRLANLSRNDIYNDVYRARIMTWKRIDQNVIELIKAVSSLYQYEIPCHVSYLNEIGLFAVSTKLSEEGILIETDGSVVLHHASIARLYLETLEYMKIIGDYRKVSMDVLLHYIDRCVTQRSRVFSYLSSYMATLSEAEVSVFRNLLKMISPDQIQGEMLGLIDINKVGILIRSLSSMDKEFVIFALNEDVVAHLEHHFVREPSLMKRSRFISDISLASEELASRFRNVNFESIAIIPARNERESIVNQINRLRNFADRIIVVDDSSLDDTAKRAEEAGAEVHRRSGEPNIHEAMLIGIKMAYLSNVGLSIVSSPFPPLSTDMSEIIRPVLDDRADFVQGRLNQSPSFESQLLCLALNRKAMNAYIRCMDNEKAASYISKYSLSAMPILFSKILRVLEVEVRLRFEPSVYYLGYTRLRALHPSLTHDMLRRRAYTEYFMTQESRI